MLPSSSENILHTSDPLTLGFFRPEPQKCTMRDFRLPPRRRRRAQSSDLNQLLTSVKKLRISFGKLQWLSTSFLNLDSKSVESTISLCASYLVCKTLLSKHLTSVCWKGIRTQLYLRAAKIVRPAIHTTVMNWTRQRSTRQYWLKYTLYSSLFLPSSSPVHNYYQLCTMTNETIC